MSRFCNGLLTAFRVIQFLLSLAVLACGAYILSEFFSLADAARDLQQGIEFLTDPNKLKQLGIPLTAQDSANITKFGDVLKTVLIPILKYFQDPSTRAIIIAATSFWSVIVIIYLFFAQRTTTKPGMNKRRIRVLLELVTFLAWLTCVICAVLLAAQYGIITMAGGIQAKTAIGLLKNCLKEILEKLFKDKPAKNIMQSLEIVDDITTIGILAILTTAAACICTLVSVVSFFVACCVKGRSIKKDASPGGESTQVFLQDSPSEKVMSSSVREVKKPVSWQKVNPFARPSSSLYQSPQNVVTYQPIQHHGQSLAEQGKARSPSMYGQIGHVNQQEQQRLTTHYEQNVDDTQYHAHPSRSYLEQSYSNTYYQQQNQAIYPTTQTPKPYSEKPLPAKPLPTPWVEQTPNTQRQQIPTAHQEQASSPYRDQVPNTYQPQQNNFVYYQPPTHASNYVQQGFPSQYDQQSFGGQLNTRSPTDQREAPSLSGLQNRPPNNRNSIARKPVGQRSQQSPGEYHSPSNFSGYHAR